MEYPFLVYGEYCGLLNIDPANSGDVMDGSGFAEFGVVIIGGDGDI